MPTCTVAGARCETVTYWEPTIPIPAAYITTNQPDYYRDYNGFELSASKRYSNRWMMSASYAFNTAVEHYDSANAYEDPTNIDKRDGAQFAPESGGSGIDNVFTPDFLAQVDTTDPLHQQQAVWQQVREGSALNRMLAYDWRYTLAEADLPKVCGTTSLASVAVGFPFLDERVVDFSLRLPTDYKLKGLKLRWFFKEARRGFLPDEIITKKKQGFGLPFGVWANKHAGLRALAADSLHSLAGRGIVRREFIETLLDRHLPEHPGYYGEMVWILMMMEQWLRAVKRNEV